MTETAATPKCSTARRAVTFLAWTGLVVAALGYPAAYLLDRAAGKDVISLPGDAFDAAQVKQLREEFDDSEKDPDKRRQAIVGIYGPSTKAEVVRVLFVDDSEIIRPAEDPSLALLPPKKDGGHRIQAASAYFAAKLAAVGGVLAFAGLLLLRRFLK